MVVHRTVGRGDKGSTPPAAGSKLRPFTLLCLCLWEEIIKVAGPFARGSKSSHTGYVCHLLWTHESLQKHP